MRVLLLSMPDSFEHTPTVAMRMPNGALASLAGSLDRHHEVAIADLVLVQSAVAPTVARLVRTFEPDIVGLSVMTFQRRTAGRLIRLIRTLTPRATIVAGGYDPSLAPEAYQSPEIAADIIVRGEGEMALREVTRALEARTPLDAVRGITYRVGDFYHTTPDRPVATLADGTLGLPDRGARVLSGYTFLGRQVDIVETSRGCTYDCAFCSIIEMRGRNFHRFTLDRVLDDIGDARTRGARTIFLVDDNITLDVPRFKRLCECIVEAGLDDVDYIVQAMTSPIAANAETLPPLMRRAGMRYVFLGIENVLGDDLVFLKASAKNALRRGGRTVGNATIDAIDALHRHGMYVVGGLIVGNPDDTPEAIEANLAFARRYVDWPYIQHPTPYPRTPMSRDFEADGLIVNRRLEEYDGTTAVVRSRHLPAYEIEYLRWRAERWMKVRHFPAALAHDPGFVIRHAGAMLGHTFRGCTWRTLVGLESSRIAFERYRALRAGERNLVPEEPDAMHDVARGPADLAPFGVG